MSESAIATIDPPPAAARRRGNPNLHLAPRCGARTRSGTPCQAPAISGKARCRMHGGRSTGPRTAEGRQRLRELRLAEGAFGAECRARVFNDESFCRYGRLYRAAMACRDFMPAEFAARLSPNALPPPEWETQYCRSRRLTLAEERALREAQEAGLAPWREAIALARLAMARARHAAKAGRSGGAKPRDPGAVHHDARRDGTRDASGTRDAGGWAWCGVGENLAPGPHAPGSAANAPTGPDAAPHISVPGPHAPEALPKASPQAPAPRLPPHGVPACL